MYYPDDVIENVRYHSNIIDVVSRYVKLQKKGKYLFGLCPFHSEKTPSFSVDQEKQIFYCHGCNKGGDVFRFIMDIDNVDFSESVKKLADFGRVELPESTDKQVAEKNRVRNRQIEMNADAARFFFNTLMSEKGVTGLEYFTKRGISVGTIRKFGLGYAPNGWDSLYNHLSKKGFVDDEMVMGGLTLKKKDGGYIDRFRGRVMFPIFDPAGKVIAFGGRVVDNSMPKYTNSPETLAFSKGKGLYGLNFAKKTKTKQFILVEGYLDVIALHSNGVDNAVAPLGTALTRQQAALLKYYASDVIISFDSDAAGKAATYKGIDILTEAGFNVAVLTIPEGKDPDGFIRERGSREFKKLMTEAKSVVDYKIHLLREQYLKDNQLDGKVKFLESVAVMLSNISSEIEREIYVKDISQQYEISEQALIAEMNKRYDAGTRESFDRFNAKIGANATVNGFDVGGVHTGRGVERGVKKAATGANAVNSADAVNGASSAIGVSNAHGESASNAHAIGGSDAHSMGASSAIGSSNTVGSSVPAASGRSVHTVANGAAIAAKDGATIGVANGATIGVANCATIVATARDARINSSVRKAYGAGAETEGFSDVNREELFIIALLCVDNSLSDLVMVKMPLDRYEDANIKAAADYIYSKLKKEGEVNPPEIMRLLPPEVADIYSHMLLTECHCESNSKAIEQKLIDIEKKKNMNRMLELIKMTERGDVTKEEMEVTEAELRRVMGALKTVGVQVS